jgi:hypothetical protein
LHILNCVCIYRVKKNYKCYDKDNYVQFAAKRLTADSWSVIVNDYYNRPLPERPYYYIHNINLRDAMPTNPYNELGDGTGTDMNGTYSVPPSTDSSSTNNSNLPRTITLTGGAKADAVERETAMRYGNSSTVRMEIRYGHDDSIFSLEKVFIDYIKTPQFIRLTQE